MKLGHSSGTCQARTLLGHSLDTCRIHFNVFSNLHFLDTLQILSVTLLLHYQTLALWLHMFKYVFYFHLCIRYYILVKNAAKIVICRKLYSNIRRESREIVRYFKLFCRKLSQAYSLYKCIKMYAIFTSSNLNLWIYINLCSLLIISIAIVIIIIIIIFSLTYMASRKS